MTRWPDHYRQLLADVNRHSPDVHLPTPDELRALRDFLNLFGYDPQLEPSALAQTIDAVERLIIAIDPPPTIRSDL